MNASLAPDPIRTAPIVRRRVGTIPTVRSSGEPSGRLRVVKRSVGLIAAFAIAALRYALTVAFARREERSKRRALWLHRCARAFSRVLGLQVNHRGQFPTGGMIVSNHLSYLDILAFGSIAPCVFVAKREVSGWPIIGAFARMAGTIFVDRQRRSEVSRTNASIADVLHSGISVVLFPEGTSSDGRTVLPFKSSLLEPAVATHCPITAAGITYSLDEGSVADEVCYWRDMTLLPHLLNLFAKRGVLARVAFGTGGFATTPSSRKEAAQQLHDRVSKLHALIEERPHSVRRPLVSC